MHYWVVDDSDSSCESLDLDEDDYMCPISFDLDGEKCPVFESQAKLSLKLSNDMNLVCDSENDRELPLEPRRSSTAELKAVVFHFEHSETHLSSQDTRETHNIYITNSRKSSENLLKFENWANFEDYQTGHESER